jgi:hypothetical protein
VAEEVLAEEPRPGTPPTFGPGQLLVRIVASACEDPREEEEEEESGGPITRWTPPELADEPLERGIVRSISPRGAWGVFWGEAEPSKPHLTRYYRLNNGRAKEPEVFDDAEVRALREHHARAPPLREEEGVHPLSTDEKSSIPGLLLRGPIRPFRRAPDWSSARRSTSTSAVARGVR